MCIRDRNIAVQESTTAHIYAQEELGIEPLAFKNANECATAVMGGKADAAILDKVPAVSYTHLDVYKRQLSRSPSTAIRMGTA